MKAKLRKPNESPMCQHFSKWCTSFNHTEDMEKWTGKRWIAMFMVFLDDQYKLERKDKICGTTKKQN